MPEPPVFERVEDDAGGVVRPDGIDEGGVELAGRDPELAGAHIHEPQSVALQNELRLVTGDERSQHLVKLVVGRLPRVVEKLSLNSATSAYPAGSATSRRISRVTPSNSLTTSGASVGGPNRLSQIVRGSRPSAATATPAADAIRLAAERQRQPPDLHIRIEDEPTVAHLTAIQGDARVEHGRRRLDGPLRHANHPQVRAALVVAEKPERLRSRHGVRRQTITRYT